MIELYSIRDVARILAVQESRLRYWMQTGFVGPTVRKGGRFYYTFCDLVAVKSAKDLLAADVSLQNARKNVEALKKALPDDTHPTSQAARVLRRRDDRRARRRRRVRADRRPGRDGVHAAELRRARRRGARDAARRSARSDAPSRGRRTRRPRPTAARPRIATSSRRAPPRIAATRRPPSTCSARRSISSRTWRPR